MTSTARAIPGMAKIHQALARYPFPEAIDCPQETDADGRPSPRKLRAASARMALANSVVASASVGPAMNGRMCRLMIRLRRTPITVADLTQSRSRSVMDIERERRAKPIQLVTLSAMITIARLRSNTPE